MRTIVLIAALLALAPAAAQAPRAELFVRAPAYSEGPAWRGGSLFFCSRGLRRVGPDRKVVRSLAVSPAGTVVLGDGRLLVCDNRHKALLQVGRDGRVSVLADRHAGKPLRLLNDLTVDRAGNVYWTDPRSYDPKKPDGNVFRMTPAGVVSRIASGRAFPNGIEVDPRNRYLYLVESSAGRLLRYDLPAPGRPLGKPVVFFRYRTNGDGLAFDAAGNLWTTEFLGKEVIVLSPGGKVIARHPVPAQALSNLCFGGPRADTLFVTAGKPDGVFRLPAGVRGFAGHPGGAYRVVRTLRERAK